MQPRKIVSRDEWLVARKAHLAKEKELTQARDKLSAERRALPWVKVDKDYVFDAPKGKKRNSIPAAPRNSAATHRVMM